MSDVDELEATLAKLKAERSAVDVTMTRENLVSSVDAWLEAARARAAGSSTFVLNGQPVGEHLGALLAEGLLADDAVAGRGVKRVGGQGVGALSDRAEKQQLGKLDEKMAADGGRA